MYYCRTCGYRSQGDFCANRKCGNFSCISPEGQRYQAFESNRQSNHFCSDSNLRITPNNMDEPYDMQRPEQLERNDIRDMRGMQDARDVQFGRDAQNMCDTRNIRGAQNMRDTRNMRGTQNMMDRCRMPEVPCNDQLQLAFATVPFQAFGEVYPFDEGLIAGTIFPELDMPYAKRKRLGAN